MSDAGPWRVDEHWWGPALGTGTRLARDEYDVCLDDGALLRIAREGGAVLAEVCRKEFGVPERSSNVEKRARS